MRYERPFYKKPHRGLLMPPAHKGAHPGTKTWGNKKPPELYGGLCFVKYIRV
jgi:hypothetical protein